MRIAAWLVVLAGCDDLFNLERLDTPIDAPPFVLDRDCPTSYALRLFAGSRYRVTEGSPFAWDASDECNADNPGFTHLAAAQTQLELDALHGSLGAMMMGRWWIGAVQPVTVTLPIDGWIWVTGEAVDRALWASPGEPNDGNDVEDDHGEQFAIISAQTSALLIDIGGNLGNRALCECDGRPISNAAQMAIDQARTP